MPVSAAPLLAAKRCNGFKRNGEPCGNPAIAGRANGKCRMHNGNAAMGIANPAYKTGRYSQSAPARYQAQIEASLADPELLSLKPDLALLDSRCHELIARLEVADPLTDAQVWQDIREWMEARRKLSESEQKRMIAMQQMVTMQQLNTMMSIIIASIKANVSDRSALANISRDISRASVIPILDEPAGG